MIEKLAVVGEMLPADDDTDLFATWLYPLRDEGPLGIDEYALGLCPAFTRARTIVGEPGGEDEFWEKAAKPSGEAPSSCIIIDILDGSVAKTEDATLERFRCGGTNAPTAS